MCVYVLQLKSCIVWFNKSAISSNVVQNNYFTYVNKIHRVFFFFGSEYFPVPTYVPRYVYIGKILFGIYYFTGVVLGILMCCILTYCMHIMLQSLTKILTLIDFVLKDRARVAKHTIRQYIEV